MWSGVPVGEMDSFHSPDRTCEMALFVDVVPRGGQWAGTVLAEMIEGGPARMAPLLNEAAAHGAGPDR